MHGLEFVREEDRGSSNDGDPLVDSRLESSTCALVFLLQGGQWTLKIEHFIDIVGTEAPNKRLRCLQYLCPKRKLDPDHLADIMID